MIRVEAFQIDHIERPGTAGGGAGFTWLSLPSLSPYSVKGRREKREENEVEVKERGQREDKGRKV